MNDTTEKVICPVCQGTNCFKTEADEAFSYLCMRCGRTTNTHFKDGSLQLEAALENQQADLANDIYITIDNFKNAKVEPGNNGSV